MTIRTTMNFTPEAFLSARILHWQTMRYAEHNAFGGFYDALDGMVDRFVEAYQGKYGRVRISNPINCRNYDQAEPMSFADDVLVYLNTLQKSCPDSELKNILDEMKAETDKLKYLLTLS